MRLKFLLWVMAAMLVSITGLSQNRIFDFSCKYATDRNVCLFYKDGKLMLKVTVASTDIQQKNVFIRKVVDGETVEPVPDTLRGKAADFMGEEVFVDDSVALRVKEMIKSLRLTKMKERYDNVYKKDEIQEMGGSFWEVKFLNPKGEMQQSGGRYRVNRKKTQAAVNKYMERLRTICLYLQSVEAKFCPPKQ